MKYMTRLLRAALLATILLLASCKKDDTLQYGNLTLGNFVEDKFISDQGNEFTIVENQTGYDFKDIQRAIMQCDVLRKVKGTKNGYEVRVHYVSKVLTKSPVETAVADDDPEKIVEDPIRIEDVWISGGYLNMYVMFEIQTYPQKEDSKHMVNLIFTESEVGTGKYNLTLRHNSFGETLATDEDDSEGEVETDSSESTVQIKWSLSGAYVGFQISDIIQENKAEITLKWKEHVISGYNWLAETHDRTINLAYSKDYFEQAPLSLSKARQTSLN